MSWASEMTPAKAPSASSSGVEPIAGDDAVVLGSALVDAMRGHVAGFDPTDDRVDQVTRARLKELEAHAAQGFRLRVAEEAFRGRIPIEHTMAGVHRDVRERQPIDSWRDLTHPEDS